MIPVLEVHLGEDGIWEAYDRPVFGSDDVEVVASLDHLPHVDAAVRVGGIVTRKIVYCTGDDEGWIVRD
jgi:hypothetical protein